MPVQLRHNLDVHGALERLPVVARHHPVGSPSMFHWLKRKPVGHLNINLTNVAWSPDVLDQNAQPIGAGAVVDAELDVGASVPARHSLVEEVVQAPVAKLALSARKRHGIDGSSAHVKCILPSATVSSTGAEIGHDNLCAEGIAELGSVAGINAPDLVALATTKPVCVDRATNGNNLGTDGSALEPRVTAVPTWTKKSVRKSED